MKSFIWILIFTVFLLMPKNGFTLTYDKKNKSPVDSTNNEKGWTQEREGLWLNGVGELSNCKKLNTNNFSILRQGTRITFDPKGNLFSLEKGLFDCSRNEKNTIIPSIYEGLTEYSNGVIRIRFKNDDQKAHIYERENINKPWHYFDHKVEYLAHDKQASPRPSRILTQDETKHADLLYTFYKNIDVTSASAKRYDKINDVENLAAFAEERNKTIKLEQDKKQNFFKEKQAPHQQKLTEEQIKISKMKPEDRHAYTCNEKFGFRKGSNKFKDCVFEMYKAETELEKLELQKQVAKANADAARANAEVARAGAERQERLALAQTEAAKMQAYALEQQAIASKTANNLILLETGLRMLSPAPAPPRTATTCSFNGRFMNCF
jgi:hypothetical protein